MGTSPETQVFHMDFLRRNRIRLGCVISTAIMLAGIAFLWSVLLGPGKWRTATPHMVDVIVMMGKSRRKLEIRDPSAIVVLQSLITGGRTIDARPPSRPEFEIFVHPPGKRSYAYSPSPVWRTADGFAWQHDGRVTALDGSLTDFIEWLKIRRINQLLEALDPQQRQLGEQLRDALRQQHVESLIRIANSPNGWFAQSGIREIAEFISVEPARLNLYIPGEMQWPGRRAVADPNRRIRDELLRLVTICPRAEHAKDPFGAGVMALECLQQVGDRKTADALMKLPERHRGGWLEDRLLTTIERLYGIPATYERFFICGNSSAEELAESAKELSRRQAAAMDDLMAWQKEIAGDSDEQFYDAVVLRWSEMLIHIAKTPDRSGYLNDPTPAPQLTNRWGSACRLFLRCSVLSAPGLRAPTALGSPAFLERRTASVGCHRSSH